MIDLRYHVYSLAAVFFALALGIVIGTSFSRLAPGSKSERKTITRYAESMKTLKDQIEKVGNDIEHNQRIIRDMDGTIETLEPYLIKGKLASRHVAILQTGDYDQIVTEARRALEESGAIVTSVTEISRSFDFTNDVKIAKALVDSGISNNKKGQTGVDRLMEFISNAICEGRPSAILATLERHNIAKFRGDYTRSNDLVLIVGGSESDKTDTSETIDAALISFMDRSDLTIAACEPSDCGFSYVTTWHKQGIASIDNADWASGHVNIVYALNGEKARFGIKDTSDQTITKRLELNE